MASCRAHRGESVRAPDQRKVTPSMLADLLDVVIECEAGLVAAYDVMCGHGFHVPEVEDELFRVQRALALLRVSTRARLVSLAVSSDHARA